MFCKFLVCHGFDLFFCQAMALLVLPEKKIHKEIFLSSDNVMTLSLSFPLLLRT